MVKWVKQGDGTWGFDYSVFDEWVQFMMDLGIKDQINAYSLIPWTNELVYYDESERENVTVKVETGSRTPFQERS